MKVTARANYGHVGKSGHYIPAETAKMSLEKMGYEVRDLGDGVLEYDMEISEENEKWILGEIENEKHFTRASGETKSREQSVDDQTMAEEIGEIRTGASEKGKALRR